MMRQRIAQLDKRIVRFMSRVGHRIERWVLGILFIWFGTLKIIGETSASSIIAKSVYWMDPSFVVPCLGWWELLIGIGLILPRLNRMAILLLLVRLPGTFMALVYHYPACFTDSIFFPTIQGQYLLKEFTLVGAALVIGSAVKRMKSPLDKKI